MYLCSEIAKHFDKHVAAQWQWQPFFISQEYILNEFSE